MNLIWTKLGFMPVQVRQTRLLPCATFYAVHGPMCSLEHNGLKLVFEGAFDFSFPKISMRCSSILALIFHKNIGIL